MRAHLELYGRLTSALGAASLRRAAFEMLSARGRLVKCLDLKTQATLASIVTITVIRSTSGLQLTVLALTSTVVREALV